VLKPETDSVVHDVEVQCQLCNGTGRIDKNNIIECCTCDEMANTENLDGHEGWSEVDIEGANNTLYHCPKCSEQFPS